MYKYNKIYVASSYCFNYIRQLKNIFIIWKWKMLFILMHTFPMYFQTGS